MSEATRFLMLTTSATDRAEAEALARALVEARLAACVQLAPIDSVYRWNDAIEAAGEILLIAKIRAGDFAEVEAAIRQRHSYDVPEIVAVPIVAGSAAYLDWISISTVRGPVRADPPAVTRQKKGGAPGEAPPDRTSETEARKTNAKLRIRPADRPNRSS